MAHVVIFPNQTAFELGARLAGAERCGVEAQEPPEFCKGLIPHCVVISGGSQAFQNALREQRVPIAGMLEFKRFTRDVPEGAPPDGRWKEIVGDLLLSRVEPSISDSLRLRVEIVPAKDLGPLIPIMARLIRGGAYRPEGPILAFEEEHRLICLSSKRIVFSRVDDLLDMWIMLRCTVDLIIAAWERRSSLRPETSPRLGIGAVEIYKRLPATNCGRCDNPNCMEFATGLLTGRCKVEQCLPLAEGDPRYLSSLVWLMSAIGLTACRSATQPSADRVTEVAEAT